MTHLRGTRKELISGIRKSSRAAKGHPDPIARTKARPRRTPHRTVPSRGCRHRHPNQARAVADTNEIPTLPRLLAPLPLAGTIVTADALHTQAETAQFLVAEKRADYVFTVKDNQPTLREDIAALRLDACPPAGHDHG